MKSDPEGEKDVLKERNAEREREREGGEKKLWSRNVRSLSSNLHLLISSRYSDVDFI